MCLASRTTAIVLGLATAIGAIMIGIASVPDSQNGDRVSDILGDDHKQALGILLKSYQLNELADFVVSADWVFDKSLGTFVAGNWRIRTTDNSFIWIRLLDNRGRWRLYDEGVFIRDEGGNLIAKFTRTDIEPRYKD